MFLMLSLLFESTMSDQSKNSGKGKGSGENQDKPENSVPDRQKLSNSKHEDLSPRFDSDDKGKLGYICFDENKYPCNVKGERLINLDASMKKTREEARRKIRREQSVELMKFEMYEDVRGRWRWRLKATNGETIAISSESYTTRLNCQRSIELVKSAYDAPVYVLK